jgi:hypothetical protein
MATLKRSIDHDCLWGIMGKLIESSTESAARSNYATGADRFLKDYIIIILSRCA